MKSHRSIYDHNDLKGPLENMALPYYRTVGGGPAGFSRCEKFKRRYSTMGIIGAILAISLYQDLNLWIDIITLQQTQHTTYLKHRMEQVTQYYRFLHTLQMIL